MEELFALLGVRDEAEAVAAVKELLGRVRKAEVALAGLQVVPIVVSGLGQVMVQAPTSGLMELPDQQLAVLDEAVDLAGRLVRDVWRGRRSGIKEVSDGQ